MPNDEATSDESASDGTEPWRPTRLVLIRHGESNVTVARVIGGRRTCSGLSDLGRRQSQRLAERLAETGELAADVLFTSDYPRAIETAAHIAPVFGCEPVVEPGFGEHDPGPECDGLTFDEFVARHGAPDWESDPYAETFPGGETIAQFDLRVGTTLSNVIACNIGRTIVVVCHGGVIDGIFRSNMRTPRTGVFELFTANTSLTEFVHVGPGRWRLVRYNDAAHLAGLPVATPRD